jgi:hypothetical protein
LAAAEAGAVYLEQNLQPDGQFVYRRNALTGRPITTEYDPRRHFGALWALLDLRGHEPAVQAAAAQAVEWAIHRYYVRTSQGGAFEHDDWLITGCSGLALLVLDELASEHAREVADGVRAELVEFLLANQLTSGGRRHDFPHQIAPQPLTVDLAENDVTVRPRVAAQRNVHYTGQILFGLVTYLSTVADGLVDGRFADVYPAVGRAVAALMARDYGVRQQSPWLMYGIRGFAELTDRLLAANGQGEGEVARQCRRELLAWSGRIIAGALAGAAEERDPRTVPVAGRAQAQAQFLDLVDSYPTEVLDQPRWDGLAGSVRDQLERDCALLLSRQDPETGGFLGSAELPIMQIDDTQHAVSALLGAALLLGD